MPAFGRLLSALTLALTALSTSVQSQGAAKTARAVRITGEVPRIDGNLDDPAWSRAPVISDFVQKIPVAAIRSRLEQRLQSHLGKEAER